MPAETQQPPRRLSCTASFPYAIPGWVGGPNAVHKGRGMNFSPALGQGSESSRMRVCAVVVAVEATLPRWLVVPLPSLGGIGSCVVRKPAGMNPIQ